MAAIPTVYVTQPDGTRYATPAYRWTGSFVQGSTACAIVKYHGPTYSRGSRWIATLIRGKGETYRATVSYSDGPIAAALAAAEKAGCPHWEVSSVNTIDADAYCIGFAAG